MLSGPVCSLHLTPSCPVFVVSFHGLPCFLPFLYNPERSTTSNDFDSSAFELTLKSLSWIKEGQHRGQPGGYREEPASALATNASKQQSSRR